MTSETLRVADQLRRAFGGDAWHGPPLRELLSGVTAEQAALRPVSSWHTIWELVMHIDIYVRIALEATHGIPMPKLYGTEKDWPVVTDDSTSRWKAETANLFANGEKLAVAIEGFADERLKGIVPGREYDFYHLFHGIVQHSLYHGGQIALLKRAVSEL
jgi:DinB superfamily